MKLVLKFCAIAVAVTLSTAVLSACSSETELPSEDESTQTSSMSVNTDSQENGSEADSYDPPLTGTYENGSTPEFSGNRLRLTVNGEEEV